MAEQEFTVSADANWQAFMAAADGACLNAETIAQLGRGAALLLRVAKVGTSPDDRAAERWLSTMLHTSALAGAVLGDVDRWLSQNHTAALHVRSALEGDAA